MLKKIANVLWYKEGLENKVTPDDLQAQFVLFYNKLTIGILSINHGKWTFNVTFEGIMYSVLIASKPVFHPHSNHLCFVIIFRMKCKAISLNGLA